jgi:hypothetical protein
MTDAPRKRPWLQYHLSTAVVLMFVAAGFMGINCQKRIIVRDDGGVEEIGWPSTMYYREFCYLPGTFPKADVDAVLRQKDRNFHVEGIGAIEPSIWGWQRSTTGIVVNALAAAVLLAACGVLCENLIRRRERP